jgi:hypothetical protein
LCDLSPSNKRTTAGCSCSGTDGNVVKPLRQFGKNTNKIETGGVKNRKSGGRLFWTGRGSLRTRTTVEIPALKQNASERELDTKNRAVVKNRIGQQENSGCRALPRAGTAIVSAQNRGERERARDQQMSGKLRKMNNAGHRAAKLTADEKFQR